MEYTKYSKNEQISLQDKKSGHCAGCGKNTKRWSITYKWYICVKCKSLDVLHNIADHVTNPNG